MNKNESDNLPMDIHILLQQAMSLHVAYLAFTFSSNIPSNSKLYSELYLVFRHMIDTIYAVVRGSMENNNPNTYFDILGGDERTQLAQYQRYLSEYAGQLCEFVRTNGDQPRTADYVGVVCYDILKTAGVRDEAMPSRITDIAHSKPWLQNYTRWIDEQVKIEEAING